MHVRYAHAWNSVSSQETFLVEKNIKKLMLQDLCFCCNFILQKIWSKFTLRHLCTLGMHPTYLDISFFSLERVFHPLTLVGERSKIHPPGHLAIAKQDTYNPTVSGLGGPIASFPDFTWCYQGRIEPPKVARGHATHRQHSAECY